MCRKPLASPSSSGGTHVPSSNSSTQRKSKSERGRRSSVALEPVVEDGAPKQPQRKPRRDSRSGGREGGSGRQRSMSPYRRKRQPDGDIPLVVVPDGDPVVLSPRKEEKSKQQKEKKKSRKKEVLALHESFPDRLVLDDIQEDEVPPPPPPPPPSSSTSPGSSSHRKSSSSSSKAPSSPYRKKKTIKLSAEDLALEKASKENKERRRSKSVDPVRKRSSSKTRSSKSSTTSSKDDSCKPSDKHKTTPYAKDRKRIAESGSFSSLSGGTATTLSSSSGSSSSTLNEVPVLEAGMRDRQPRSMSLGHRTSPQQPEKTKVKKEKSARRSSLGTQATETSRRSSSSKDKKSSSKEQVRDKTPKRRSSLGYQKLEPDDKPSRRHSIGSGTTDGEEPQPKGRSHKRRSSLTPYEAAAEKEPPQVVKNGKKSRHKSSPAKKSNSSEMDSTLGESYSSNLSSCLRSASNASLPRPKKTVRFDLNNFQGEYYNSFDWWASVPDNEMLWWSETEIEQRWQRNLQIAFLLEEPYNQLLCRAFDSCRHQVRLSRGKIDLVNTPVDLCFESLQQLSPARGLEAELCPAITERQEQHSLAVLDAQEALWDEEASPSTIERVLRLQSRKHSRVSQLFAVKMAQYDTQTAQGSIHISGPARYCPISP